MSKARFRKDGSLWGKTNKAVNTAAVLRGLDAARYALDNKVTTEAACAKYGSNRAMVSECILIHQHATPEEIAEIRAGKMGVRPIARNIRQRMTPEQRREKRKTQTFSEESLEAKKIEAAMWQPFRKALDTILGLPLPKDFVTVIKRSGSRAKTIDEKLLPVFSWLSEFSDAWTAK